MNETVSQTGFMHASLFHFFAEGVDPFLRAKANAEFELDRANKKHDAVIEEAERPLKSAKNAARAEYDAVFKKQSPIKFEIDQKLSVHRGVWSDSIEKADKEFAPHEDRIMGLINEAFEKYKPHTIKTEELKNERIDEENKHKSKIRNAGAAFGPHSEKFSRSLRHIDQTFSIDSPEHKKAVADAMEAIRPHKEILDQAKSNADKDLDDYLVKHNKAMDEANAELEPHKQAFHERQEALLAELQPHRDKRNAAWVAANDVFDPHAKEHDIAMKKANDSLDEARKIATDKIGDAEDEHEDSGRAEIVRREKRKRFATLSRFSTQMQNAPDPQNVEYKFHLYSEHGGKQLHAVTAHHNGEQVGHIRWANDQIQTHHKLSPGEIGYIGVIPVYERHGIATNLVKKAREFYESGEASTRAEHSDDKTDQGQAWYDRIVEKDPKMASLLQYFASSRSVEDLHPKNVEYKFHYNKSFLNNQFSTHGVTAHHNGKVVGHLYWADDTHGEYPDDTSDEPDDYHVYPGDITHIQVTPEYQRHGIATTMLQKAHEAYASGEATTKPVHVDDLSKDAEAWINSLPTHLSLLQHFASDEDPFLTIKKQEDASLQNAINKHENEYYKSKSEDAFLDFQKNLDEANKTYTQNMSNAPHPQNIEYHFKESPEKGGSHRITAHHNNEQIGVLSWTDRHGDDLSKLSPGEIDWIEVDQGYQYHGIASKMLTKAHEAHMLGLADTKPIHSNRKTGEGRAWHDHLVKTLHPHASKNAPEPLENPEEGGHTWYHGTQENFEENPRMKVNEKSHWNIHLGPHFTSLKKVAYNFATRMSTAPRWIFEKSSYPSYGKIKSFTIEGNKPKIYPNENDMREDFVKQTNLELPQEYYGKDLNHKWNPAVHCKHCSDLQNYAMINIQHHSTEKMGHEYEPAEIGSEGFSCRDCYKGTQLSQRWSSSADHHERQLSKDKDDFVSYKLRGMNGNDRRKLVNRFKKNLKDNGHTAIVYGNSYEEPIGHKCAIPLKSSALKKIGEEDVTKNANERTAVLDSWRPNQRLFAPTIGSLDPRLFEDDKIRPEIRESIINRIAELWDSQYKEWKNWSKVYIAGSSVSQWWADPSAVKNPEIGASQGYHLNDDLDTLIGIEYGGLIESNPQFATMSPEKISAHMNAELREHCNIEEAYFNVPFIGIPKWEWNGEPFGGKIKVGPWSATFYVNPHSYDISVLKPYAAYNLTDDEWAVRPIEAPEGHQFNQSEWYYFEGLAVEIENILKLPEPSRNRRARQLWEFIHESRKGAFKPSGRGVFDYRNAAEKYLDQKGLWQPLVNARFGIDKKEGAQ